MSDKTHAELIKEMNCGPIPEHRHDREILRLYAHELDAAHKREIEATAAKCCQLGRLAGYGASEIKHQQESVGNAAKLREALVYLIQNESTLFEANLTGGELELLHLITNKARAASAAPPRNCERFASAEEAWDAYDEWVESYRAKGKIPPFNEFGWLYATATEKKGDNDGNE